MKSGKTHTVRKWKYAAAAASVVFAMAQPAKAASEGALSQAGDLAFGAPLGSAVQATVTVAKHFGRHGLSFAALSNAATQNHKFQLTDSTTTGSIPKSFFGTVAVPFSSITVRSQWDRVRLQQLPSATDCGNAACKARVAKLSDAAARGKSLDFSTKLRLANATVNSVIAYKSDRAAYGKVDHWASSREMVQKGAGDCEDFAILKQTLLRAMGVPDKSLSIVILKDNARNLYHAVLGVSTNQGNLVLDNVRANVFRDTQVSNYQPLFSFSGSRSWVHGVASGSTNVAARSTPALNSVAPGESAIVPVLIAGSGFSLEADLRPTLRY